MERRSLLPRLLYLSIQSVSTSIKENFEIDGSLSDLKISTELKLLLESYAKMLDSTFEDAVELVTAVSNGLSSYKVCSCLPLDMRIHSWRLNSCTNIIL